MPATINMQSIPISTFTTGYIYYARARALAYGAFADRHGFASPAGATALSRSEQVRSLHGPDGKVRRAVRA